VERRVAVGIPAYYCVKSLAIREKSRGFPSPELFREIAGFINDSKLASGFLRFTT
jgi:hypothetical protein